MEIDVRNSTFFCFWLSGLVYLKALNWLDDYPESRDLFLSGTHFCSVNLILHSRFNGEVKKHF